MAKRIEKPEVGKTYWDLDGDKCTVLLVDGDYAIGYWLTSAGKKSATGWNRGKAGWPLYADPWKPEALPALDANKPLRLRDGRAVRNAHVVSGGDIDADFERDDRTGRSQGRWFGTGRTVPGEERATDLVQCVRRDWTQADVPYPRPTFRMVGSKTLHEFEVLKVQSNGIALGSTGSFFYWTGLASDWEYTQDGREWKKCEVWE